MGSVKVFCSHTSGPPGPSVMPSPMGSATPLCFGIQA